VKVFLIMQTQEKKRRTIKIHRIGAFRFLYYGAGLSLAELAAGFQLILDCQELEFVYKNYQKNPPPRFHHDLVIF